MASICRSAARSPAFRFKPSSLPKSLPSRSTTTPVSFSRSMSAAVGMMESLMPFHSATASARLRSFIAVDSCHWSWLSQGWELFSEKLNLIQFGVSTSQMCHGNGYLTMLYVSVGKVLKKILESWI